MTIGQVFQTTMGKHLRAKMKHILAFLSDGILVELNISPQGLGTGGGMDLKGRIIEGFSALGACLLLVAVM